jgi:hypothetical protein
MHKSPTGCNQKHKIFTKNLVVVRFTFSDASRALGQHGFNRMQQDDHYIVTPGGVMNFECHVIIRHVIDQTLVNSARNSFNDDSLTSIPD